MIVLLGETRDRRLLAAMRPLGWGRMWTKGTPNPSLEPWGFDNGAYGAWKAGTAFPEAEFLRRLDRAWRVGRPLLAVTPDLVADGQRSLEFSLRWRERLPEWPWYLAVQDGMAPADVATVLPQFSGVFLGGTTRFKGQGSTWAALAHAAGKPFHYGRASLPRRIDHARRLNADSLDTAFPLWTRERFDSFVRHWCHGSPQLDLAHTLAVAGPSGEWF